MNLTFTQINPKDKNEVLTMFKEAAEKIAKMKIDHWQYWKNPPVEKIKWVEEGIKNNEFFSIKDPEEKTLGMVRILNEDLLYWGKQEEKAVYIHSLVIKEKFEGKGFGKIVLQKIENDAIKDGCAYLRLDADSKNQKLCGYYERNGFIKVGTKQLPLSKNNLYQKKLVK